MHLTDCFCDVTNKSTKYIRQFELLDFHKVKPWTKEVFLNGAYNVFYLFIFIVEACTRTLAETRSRSVGK